VSDRSVAGVDERGMEIVIQSEGKEGRKGEAANEAGHERQTD